MSDKLYLGVEQTIITPKVGTRLFGYAEDLFSNQVHDDLHATVFLFEQGDISAIMVSIAVVALNESLANVIRKGVSEKTGIPTSNIMLASIHTHSGPATLAMDKGWGESDSEYCDKILIPRIIDAAEKAKANKQAVKMGYATGDSHIAINRRELTVKNKVILGQNPWGPYNPKMSVLSFRNEDGECVANMIHYGMHGTCAGHNLEISQDWIGVMTSRVQKLTGGVTAFFNGPEGDVGPRLTNGGTTGVSDIKHAEETGGRAAFDAMQIYNRIKWFTTPTLSAHSGMLRLPFMPRPSLEEAKAKYEKQLENQRMGSEKCMLAHYEDIINSYSEEYVEKEFMEIEQNVISLDNVVFAGFPYEPFSEIGMRIQKAAGDLEVLPVALANGDIGYFPTEDALCRGGYEIEMFKALFTQELVPNADYHLVLETLRNIGVDLSKNAK